jgi:cytochrome c-type biogenesis protein CcmF
LWRWNRGELHDEHPLGSIFSREMLFVLNNVIFVALTGAIFWGSFGAPIVSELFMDTNITLGRDYFMQVTPPLFLALFILMGIAPLSAWGATSLSRLGKALAVPFALSAIFAVFLIVTGTPLLVAILGYGVVSFAGFVALYEIYRGASARHSGLGENWIQAVVALFSRNRRRYGGYIIHLGVTIIGIGAIGSTLFQKETQQTLSVGETLQIQDYQLRYDGFTQAIAEDGRQMEIADVTLLRNGQEITKMRPRQDLYPDMPMTIAGQHSTLENDVYVLLVGWEQINASTATFKVYINPLINFVWYGGLILILGTFIAGWPTETAAVYIREHKPRKSRVGAKA